MVIVNVVISICQRNIRSIKLCDFNTIPCLWFEACVTGIKMMDEEEEIQVPINNDLERRIAEAFEVFDHAGNKSIDVREISTIIRGLGCCPSEAEIQEIIVAVENPQTPGSAHLSKFLPYVSQIITEHKYQPASPEQLLEAFHTLDPEGHGFLTKDQISTLMSQDGEPFTQEELDEMLEIAIDPHTQTVPYEYYINQLMID
nr:EF-hand calcium-binding domain-containing protein 2 isoform X2 [Leptinotarsa decemlineata]